MKICYIDETGSEENSPYYVMAGICFDFTKHSKCLRVANLAIAQIKKRYLECNKIHCKEIKTKTFLEGRSKWSQVPHIERDAFITKMLNIFQTSFTNSFDVYVSVIDNSKYKELEHPIKLYFESKWVTNALHIILQRESNIFATAKNKNHKALTFMIYDNHVDISKLNDLLYAPKKYFYEYFTIKTKKKIKNVSFESIIGEGFCIESKHSGLCQLADICCYIIRRYIELSNGKTEAYNNEKEKIKNWYNMIKNNVYIYQKLYNKNSGSDIVNFYNQLLPQKMYQILKGIE